MLVKPRERYVTEELYDWLHQNKCPTPKFFWWWMCQRHPAYILFSHLEAVL